MATYSQVLPPFLWCFPLERGRWCFDNGRSCATDAQPFRNSHGRWPSPRATLCDRCYYLTSEIASRIPALTHIRFAHCRYVCSQPLMLCCNTWTKFLSSLKMPGNTVCEIIGASVKPECCPCIQVYGLSQVSLLPRTLDDIRATRFS